MRAKEILDIDVVTIERIVDLRIVDTDGSTQTVTFAIDDLGDTYIAEGFKFVNGKWTGNDIQFRRLAESSNVTPPMRVTFNQMILDLLSGKSTTIDSATWGVISDELDRQNEVELYRINRDKVNSCHECFHVNVAS